VESSQFHSNNNIYTSSLSRSSYSSLISIENIFQAWEEFKKGERTSPCNVVKLNTGVEAIYETRSYPAAYDENTVTFFWEGTQASTQYQIIIEYAGDEKDKYQEIFKQVLSTFKFTD